MKSAPRKTNLRPTHEVPDIPELSAEWFAKAKPVGDDHADLRFTLGLLRRALGMTEVEVAAAAGMTQADFSAIENLSDVKLSTLRRYAAALGGKVEVALVLNGRRHCLDIGEPAPEGASRSRRARVAETVAKAPGRRPKAPT